MSRGYDIKGAFVFAIPDLNLRVMAFALCSFTVGLTVSCNMTGAGYKVNVNTKWDAVLYGTPATDVEDSDQAEEKLHAAITGKYFEVCIYQNKHGDISLHSIVPTAVPASVSNAAASAVLPPRSSTPVAKSGKERSCLRSLDRLIGLSRDSLGAE